VKITVSDNALKAHAKHGDLIPAPAGSCDETDPAVEEEIERVEGPGEGGTAGETGSGGGEGTASFTGEGGAPGPVAETPAEASADGGTLPFTGFAAMTLACFGLVLAAGGLLIRALNKQPAA
jgi:hypothetical protein